MSTTRQAKLAEGTAVDVKAAHYVGQYQLHIAFSDGFEREVDFEPFLRAASHPQIREYLDREKFKQFSLRDGELMWGDYDLCFPIADLYEGRI